MLNVADVWHLERFKHDSEAMETYQKILSEPTPLQKGQYAGLLKVKATEASAAGFLSFMGNS